MAFPESSFLCPSTSFKSSFFNKIRRLYEILPGWSPYLLFQNPWDFSSRNPEIPDVDERLFSTAIDQLRAIKEEHVNSKGIMTPLLLKRQLEQARRVFTAFGVTLNDSRNAIDFSAAGLQDLTSGKYMYYSTPALVIL